MKKITLIMMLLFLPFAFSDIPTDEYIAKTKYTTPLNYNISSTDSSSDIQTLPYYYQPEGSEFPVTGSFTDSQAKIIPLGN